MTSASLPNRKDTVVAISSWPVCGGVGNRALVFALQRRGHPVHALPTTVLNWHPGHGPSQKLPIASDDFEAMAGELAGNPERTGPIAAVVSGYLADTRQVAAIAALVDRLRVANPELIYLCDPVLGDSGGLYRDRTLVDAIAAELVPRADIVTPNRYELGFLSGSDAGGESELVTQAQGLDVERVVVTSAHAMRRGHIATLLVHRSSILAVEHQLVAGVPHGPGDLFAALFLSRLLDGQDDQDALSGACSSVFQVLARTAARGASELALEAEQEALIHPLAMTTSRRVLTAKRAVGS